jgi:anaerobic ribonucleoside-triphosphate reductase
MKMHPSVTLDRVVAAVRHYNETTDNHGICIACGEDAMDIEPDAREYECECCGSHRVYGAEELLLMLA